jgi:hypothetical protein
MEFWASIALGHVESEGRGLRPAVDALEGRDARTFGIPDNSDDTWNRWRLAEQRDGVHRRRRRELERLAERGRIAESERPRARFRNEDPGIFLDVSIVRRS